MLENDKQKVRDAAAPPLLLLLFVLLLHFRADGWYLALGGTVLAAGAVELVMELTPDPKEAPHLRVVSRSAAPTPPQGPRSTPAPAARRKARKKPKQRAEWPRYSRPYVQPLANAVHLDACSSSHPLTRALWAAGFEVTNSHERGISDISDEDQLAFALDRRAVLITFNCSDFERLDEAGHPHCGIVLAPNKAKPVVLVDFCRRLREARAWA